MILELSARNPRVADVRRLLRQKAQRRRTSRFVVEGPKLVVEALDSELAVDHVIVPADVHPDPDIAERCDASGARLYALDAEAFANLADAKTPQAALAVVEAPSLAFDERFQLESGFVLVLVDVADPGNVGTLLRTAEATGCGGVVLAGACADPLSPKVVRSSAGSILRVPVGEIQGDIVTELRDRGFTLVVTAMDGDHYDKTELSRAPTAYLFGNEAHGLDAATTAAADHVIAIPMHGSVESLNVATAGAVIAFDRARRDRLV
ncbi:MAG: TrmH family RNA methyltransferase [Acidimicrobiales bacterium]